MFFLKIIFFNFYPIILQDSINKSLSVTTEYGAR